MYPEGSLLYQDRTKLLSFKKDSMNPINEGYIELWLIKRQSCNQFIYRKRLTSLKALEQWEHLVKHGWTVIEEQESAA
tara:strand:+ start:253 stop:486 length:234 start_codon:yes stop_codon:yes gene_type:complete